MSRDISWFMLVVNHRFGHSFADEVLRQRLVVRMRIAHDEPPIQALPPAAAREPQRLPAFTRRDPLPPTPGRRVAPAV